MSDVGSALRLLASVLDGEGLRWFVFGAQAVAVHGIPRATQDIDITVEVDRRSLPELLGALGRAGFDPRYPELADELARTGAVVPLIQRGSAVEVDLVLAGSGLEEVALGRAAPDNVAGVRVPVVSAVDLVVMKVLAGRARDQEDVVGILGAGRVDVDEVRSILRDLEEALGQSDLVPAFESLVAGAGRPRR